MKVTWLLKNPFGTTAQPGERGDFVRVSDGRATVYLLPNEFDHADERRLRWLLAQQPTRARRGEASDVGQRPTAAHRQPASAGDRGCRRRARPGDLRP